MGTPEEKDVAVTYACKRCGVEHTYVGPGPITKTPLPSTITTTRDEKGEWIFVCAGGCKT